MRCTWTFLNFWLCRGYKRFFKRTLLETSDYLKDDCLLIHCSVGVVKSRTEGPRSYHIAVPPSDIGQHFGRLLESGKGNDVNFEVDGEIFSAHKLVLAARSPVFRAQLFGPLRDQNTKCIKVEDMEAPVFKVSLSPSHSIPLLWIHWIRCIHLQLYVLSQRHNNLLLTVLVTNFVTSIWPAYILPVMNFISHNLSYEHVSFSLFNWGLMVVRAHWRESLNLMNINRNSGNIFLVH